MPCPAATPRPSSPPPCCCAADHDRVRGPVETALGAQDATGPVERGDGARREGQVAITQARNPNESVEVARRAPDPRFHAAGVDFGLELRTEPGDGLDARIPACSAGRNACESFDGERIESTLQTSPSRPRAVRSQGRFSVQLPELEGPGRIAIDGRHDPNSSRGPRRQSHRRGHLQTPRHQQTPVQSVDGLAVPIGNPDRSVSTAVSDPVPARCERQDQAGHGTTQEREWPPRPQSRGNVLRPGKARAGDRHGPPYCPRLHCPRQHRPRQHRPQLHRLQLHRQARQHRPPS
ncbi:hypothetical protein Pla86_20130 [Planctomycetes bacterium Pla86]|nr:hypothetical protein Pla86_20130 [Planctomycetes bacterium Pla86]